MPYTTNPALIPALRAAAAFFEANPDKRVTHAFAKDAMGRQVYPRDPSATCWCALGRVLVELDEETHSEAAGTPPLAAYAGSSFGVLKHLADWNVIDPIYEHNDDRPLTDETPEVVAHLRKIADELETK